MPDDGLSPAQAAFWAAYLGSGAAPLDAGRRLHSAFGVGKGSDSGAAEILSGHKSATSSRLDAFAPGTEPVAGSLSILCGAGGRPVAIVETVSVERLSLDEMPPDFVRAYGEWDTPEAFRAGMLAWYGATDPDFSLDTPLLAERIRVVWKGT